MKKTFVLLLLTASLSAFANRESGGRRAASAVFLNFQSPGNGIDSKTFYLSKELISEASANGLVKEYTLRRWGREGEKTVCVHFQGGELNGRGASGRFIKALAPSIIEDFQDQNIRRTIVLIGASCKRIEDATVVQDISAYLD